MSENVLLFYGHRKGKKITDSCLSQFYPCAFTVDGREYSCAEQFMMAEKARVFGDEKNRAKILAESKPAWIKALGRRVKPFDAEMWATVAPNVVAVGNFAKFSQNSKLKDFLLATGDAVLAEASPVDRIWGIGLAKTDPAGKDPKKWRGKNLLGLALMTVRAELRSGETLAQFAKDHPYTPFGKNILQPLLVSAKAPIKAKTRKKVVDTTLDISRRTDVTTPSFIREVQAAVRPKPASLKDDLVKAIRPDFTAEQQAAKVKFDKIYRPFVYKVLLAPLEKDGLGFTYKTVYDTDACRYKVPYRGEISAEDVYSEVWMRLFGTDGNKPALLNFDATQKNVGRGAFRLYLRLVTKSVYYDLTRKDTMVLKDVHGHIMYQYDKHTKKYLLDKKGEKIPIRVPRSATSDETVISRRLSGLDSASRSKRAERTVFQRRISLKYLAYLHIHETKIAKGGWFYRASKDMFENRVPAEKVMKGCLERGEIKKRQSFDTALSRFRAAIDDKAAELSKAIFSADDAKIMAEGELLDREWMATAKKFGMSRVKDVRLRVMAAMMDAFELKSDEFADATRHEFFEVPAVRGLLFLL